MVKFASSASGAQGFTSSDSGCGHGTVHQAMLRWYPTEHNQKVPQPEYTTKYLGALGRRRRRTKEDWQQMLAQVPIFKKKNHYGIMGKFKCSYTLVNNTALICLSLDEVMV